MWHGWIPYAYIVSFSLFIFKKQNLMDFGLYREKRTTLDLTKAWKIYWEKIMRYKTTIRKISIQHACLDLIILHFLLLHNPFILNWCRHSPRIKMSNIVNFEHQLIFFWQKSIRMLKMHQCPCFTYILVRCRFYCSWWYTAREIDAQSIY